MLAVTWCLECFFSAKLIHSHWATAKESWIVEDFSMFLLPCAAPGKGGVGVCFKNSHPFETFHISVHRTWCLLFFNAVHSNHDERHFCQIWERWALLSASNPRGTIEKSVEWEALLHPAQRAVLDFQNSKVGRKALQAGTFFHHSSLLCKTQDYSCFEKSLCLATQKLLTWMKLPSVHFDSFFVFPKLRCMKIVPQL